jgi:hypothetical protein
MGIPRRGTVVAAMILSSVFFQVTTGANEAASRSRRAPGDARWLAAQENGRLRIPRWPCRLIVKPTLLGVVEGGWQRSETLRRQCETLAGAQAVVMLEWDRPASAWHARTRIGRQDGVVVAVVAIPPVDDAIRLVAHELQHVIEQIEGIDYEAEAKRPQSGVWSTLGGFETQAAIDAGGSVWKEVKERP